MSVQISVTTHIVGENVADAKEQLAALLGVALGKVAFLPDQPEMTAAGKVELLTTAARSIAALVPANGQEPAATTTRRTRRTRAQIEADAAAPQAESETNEPGNEESGEDDFDLLGGGDGSAEGEAAPSKPALVTRVITKEEMMDAGRQVMDKKGIPGLSAILKAHGFKQIATIPETAYAAVMADLEEALS